MAAAPPKISRTAAAGPVGNSSSRLVTVLLGGVAVVIAALVFFFNPSTHGFYPICQFHRLTGLDCPGCGTTRALYALLHGNLLTALHDNSLFVLAFPAALVRALWLAAKKSRGQPVPHFLPGKYLTILLFIALAFTILRNLPAFAFLSPD